MDFILCVSTTYGTRWTAKMTNALTERIVVELSWKPKDGEDMVRGTDEEKPAVMTLVVYSIYIRVCILSTGSCKVRGLQDAHRGSLYRYW